MPKELTLAELECVTGGAGGVAEKPKNWGSMSEAQQDRWQIKHDWKGWLKDSRNGQAWNLANTLKAVNKKDGSWDKKKYRGIIDMHHAETGT